MAQVIKPVSVSALRDGLATALRKVEHEGFAYVVRRHGVPVAALVRIDEARRFWQTTPTEPPGESEDAPPPGGYLRRLWRRRVARRARRAARAEAEAEADKWAYRNFRGMDEGV